MVAGDRVGRQGIGQAAIVGHRHADMGFVAVGKADGIARLGQLAEGIGEERDAIVLKVRRGPRADVLHSGALHEGFTD